MAIVTLNYSDINGNHRAYLDRDSISIGRSHDQDVMLSEAYVSRQHAVILREGENYTVVDQNSTHGTFLNSMRIDRAMLRSGDVLQMGSLSGPRMRFQVQQNDETVNSIPQSQMPDLLSSLHELRFLPDNVRPAAREMEKLNWLIRAARQLNESVTLEDVLGAFLHLTLQLTGLERGFVFVCEEDQMRLAHGLDTDGKTLAEDSTLSRKAMKEAIESESKFLVSDTMADESVAGWASVIANKIRSIYCIPLRKRASAKGSSQLLGLLYLDGQIRLGELTEVDHQLLDTVATEAAALLHNALLAETESKARQAREELAVAAKIHSGMMSIALPTLPYATLQARSVPCLAIGGDFYDAVTLDDCVCVVIADVSGKGVSAAIVAATLQGIIHAQLLGGQGLAEIASVVNQFLCTHNVGKYATMILLKLFPDGRVEYLNCGHIQPLSILGSEIRRLEESNLVVGLIPGASYASTHCMLQRGERLLLVTDGITEAENEAGMQFGDTGLIAMAHHDDVGSILDQVAKFHAPKEAEDDCTLVDIQYSGQASSGLVKLLCC
ncbi:MAG: protein serine/threonine phosphatase with GAF(s) sensor(s) [Edaphobacter sp.]|nr:protein serine/threonine phosphatase with GAF(s) sensor(s) [Edaphobacter sp.]